MIYRYSRRTGEVIEVTVGERVGGIRDAGGHVGGRGDLTNLRLYSCVLEEGDLLVAVSDGVHDNLDPEVLHLPPSSCGLEEETWAEVEGGRKDRAKREYKTNRLSSLIGRDPPSPRWVAETIVRHVQDLTAPLRDAHEQGSRLQCDWASLPEPHRSSLNDQVRLSIKNGIGKFDHVTCLVVLASCLSSPSLPPRPSS